MKKEKNLYRKIYDESGFLPQYTLIKQKKIYRPTKNVKNVRRIIIVVSILLFFSLIFHSVASNGHAHQAEQKVSDSEIESDLGSNVDDMLGGLDLSKLEDILHQFTEKQKELFGGTSFLQKIKLTISGDMSINFGGFIEFAFYLFGISAMGFAPLLAAIIAISLAYNVLSSIKGKFASESTDKVIYFACVGAITVLLLTATGVLISQTASTISVIRNLATTVFPILLTVMTSIGATSSVAVYQPSVAVFSVTLIELVSMVALPVFIMSFVFNIVGNLSEGVKLDQLSKFFNSGANWLMGTMFFLFLAFLSLQGVTASVFDGISIRTAKFAISKYIPIIGGYLSEGFNLVMAGGVLIKNAVGLSTILLLVSAVLPLIINLVAFSLILKLGAAFVEPMGDTKIPKILSGVSKQASILSVVIIALSFLFFVFLLLIISTGNLML
ncbi:MAG: stage III sporulation protein AE [Clostridiales bacterium]|jgi:stage III sporulation protein AE|nr:stage III sporulation protein AE [Clostridiales bacterium]